MEAILSYFWLYFFVFTVFLPFLRQKRLEWARVSLMRQLEIRRESRVITLIHRQEALALFGFPLMRYINIEDSEQVLRAIRLTPPSMPIDLILHTPGGLVLAAEQIAMALKRHPARVTVFVPHYAMSGGTMLALAADGIVMDRNAVLGPVDPQLGNYPAASILRVLQEKPRAEIDDETLILADVAEKALHQVKGTVQEILADKVPPEQAEELATALTEGRWTHDYPITFDQLQAMGLPVGDDVPEEVYELMELYPQPPQRRPSVQYIPVPYAPPPRKGGGKQG